MKKSLVAMIVGLALAAWAQTAPQSTAPATQTPPQPQQPMTPAQNAPAQAQPVTPAQTTPAQPAPAQPAQAAMAPCHPAPKKEIKDPAEYNAYTTSLNAADPNAKVAGFENFVRQFPNSAYKEDALEQLMTAYQQAGNAAKMIETAKQVLQANPNNVRALALLAYVARANAGQPGNLQQSVADARTYGESGLKALQNMSCPEGASPADVEKLQKQTSGIFHGAVGFAALQSKDYAAAQQHFQESVNAAPPTPQDSLQDVYSLALAYLEAKPINPVGLWYVARAAALSKANPQGYDAITKYGRSKYVKYHAGEDGWDQLLASAAAATSNLPPQNFAVAPAPSPAEQAAKLAASKPVAKMSFDELQLILTSGNQPVADKVWAELKGVPTAFQGKIIEASKTKLVVAATVEDIQANKADIELTMAGPIPTKDMPKVGEMLTVQGTPDSLEVNPFMIHMKDGVLFAPKKAAPKTTTTKKKTTTRRR